MNPQPPYDHNDDGFDDVINGSYHAASPYGPGIPAHSIPVKPGLTKRGKLALTVGAAVLAGGGILTWSHYDAEAKAADIQAQEIQYKRDLLALEMQKEINKTTAANQKAQETQGKELQKQVKACVDADKGLIGKQMGVTYRSVVSDCQAQYSATSNSAGMQEAASASDTSDTGGDISPSAMIGIGVGAALLVGVAANRGRKANAA